MHMPWGICEEDNFIEFVPSFYHLHRFQDQTQINGVHWLDPFPAELSHWPLNILILCSVVVL